MANEMQIQFKVTLAHGGTEMTFPDEAEQSVDVDVSGENFLHNRQTIGTSEEALLLGDVAAGGWFFAVNRDDTNYVELRAATGAQALAKLKPGEPCAFRLSAGATAPFAIADTAAVELEYWVLED